MCEHGFVYPFTAGLRALYTLAVEPPEEIGLHLPPIVFVQRSYPRIEYVVFDIGHAARSIQPGRGWRKSTEALGSSKLAPQTRVLRSPSSLSCHLDGALSNAMREH